MKKFVISLAVLGSISAGTVMASCTDMMCAGGTVTCCTDGEITTYMSRGIEIKLAE